MTRIQTGLRLEEDLWKKLNTVAEEEGISLNLTINKILVDYVENRRDVDAGLLKRLDAFLTSKGF